MAVSLHVKSHYSLGFGTASVEALVNRAAAFGYQALALTDLESLGGQPRFHDVCRRHDIRPISGVELRLDHGPRRPGSRAGRLVLLARDRAGYASLCRIVSLRRGGAGSEARQREARDPVAALAECPKGLLALSDDAEVLERARVQAGLRSEDLGLLLVRPARGAVPPIAAAGSSPVRVLADTDVAMLEAADHDLHRLLLAIRAGCPVTELDPTLPEPPERRLYRPHELQALFADVPHALAEAEAVAAECTLDLTSEAPVLPGAEPFGGAAADGELVRRCRAALADARRQGRCRGQVYEERLETELRVIGGLGYAGYFVAAAEVAEAARSAAIPVAPRGSAVGCLVVHVLGISPVDPVHHGLLFERFLHSQRSGPPDIDLDVASDRREALMRWVRRRFGRERVAMVGAYHGFRLRGALREGLKAAGAASGESEHLIAGLPDAGEDAIDPAALDQQTLGRRTRRWLPDIVRLVGKPRLLALHPAGVIMADGVLSRRLPLERGPRGLPVAQYDLQAVEQAGFVKLDVLGSKVLAQLAEARGWISGAAEPDAVLHPPADDAETLARLDRADTIGCFQVETPAVRTLLEQLPVRRLEDCVTALALVRPGAAAGAAKRDYVRRAHGEAPARSGHPWLAEHLAHTLGMLLYDEDLMVLLSAAAGISLGRADAVRSALIDAADDAARNRSLKAGFLAACRKAGTDEQIAKAVWQTAHRFAAYSFSRAHAWSYALQAHAAAYLKSHHPAAFGSALLNGYGGAYPLRTIAADLVRHGVRFLGPTVNESAALARVTEQGAVQVGLQQVKHVTARTVSRLLASRAAQGPFRSMDDLLSRVGPGRRETRALVLVGACDALPPLTADSYPFVHQALLQGLAGELAPKEFAETIARTGDDLPGGSAADSEARQRYRALVRIKHELDYLEMHVTAHPMAVLREEARRHGCRTIAETRLGTTGERARLGALLAASRRHPVDAPGPAPEPVRTMQFLTLEDETGLLEATLPPQLHPRLAGRLTTPGPYLLEGTVHDDHGHPSLQISDLLPFHQRRR